MVSLFEKKGKIRGKTAKMLEKDTLGGVCAATFPGFLELIHSGLRVDQA
jgi:hypothetical protein